MIDSIDKLTAVVGERDGFDVAMLAVTALSVLATVAAVVVALVAARGANKTAEESKKVAEDAARASEQLAVATADLLQIERLRLDGEYPAIRASATHRLIAALTAHRLACSATPYLDRQQAFLSLQQTTGEVSSAANGLVFIARGDDAEVAAAASVAATNSVAIGTIKEALTLQGRTEKVLMIWHREGDREAALADLEAIKVDAAEVQARVKS